MPEPTGTIIASIGKGLAELLKAKAGFAEGDIVLKSPVDADQNGKVSLFLYQVQEGPHFRNQDPDTSRENELRPPPLTLDLSYLVTAMAPEPDTALGPLEDVIRLWGIFPNKPYRLSVAYLVTPVKVPSARIIQMKRVIEKITKVSRSGGGA